MNQHENQSLLGERETNREFVTNNPNFSYYVMGHDGHLRAAFNRLDEAEQYAGLDARRRVLTRAEVSELLPEHRGKWVVLQSMTEVELQDLRRARAAAWAEEVMKLIDACRADPLLLELCRPELKKIRTMLEHSAVRDNEAARV
ncbi:hypothetical protein [Ralstonia pseudosolanacearum]|uniref:hypothetical protein n=1 Tax=Ralstonia pseudosolanacearum TaxID=1310165 RepID=UPI003CE68653